MPAPQGSESCGEGFQSAGDWRFSRRAAARGRCFLLSALKGQPSLAQGKREAGAAGPPSPRAPPWVNVPQLFPSPPTRFCVGREGQSGGVGCAHPPNSCFVLTIPELTTKRQIRNWSTHRPPLPTFPPESPRRRAIQGERSETRRVSTQGGAQVSCLALALGYTLTPFQGSQKEAAASCRCTS